MANVKVKMFGVIRLGSGIKESHCEATDLQGVFDYVNRIGPEKMDPLQFGDTIIFINGHRISKQKYKLSDGDEVWLMSPASGG